MNRLSAPLPTYMQIAETLLEWIESGQLKPGDRLSPERELSRTFGVTRSTLRQALRSLETLGLLDRRQGQGTYVSEPKVERHADKLVPFTRGMNRRGYATGARLISFEKVPAELSKATDLRLSVGAPIYFIQRVRLLNSQPVMLERLSVPALVFPELERHDLARRSLYEVMETEYGVTVCRARQGLEPVGAMEYEAELLAVRPGTPLMLERRLAYDQNDHPVEHGRDLYRGDRFRFVTETAPLEL